MATASSSLQLDATLAELSDLGMRAVRAVTRLMEIEHEGAAIVATRLPGRVSPAATPDEVAAARRDLDAVAAAMATAVPRVDVLVCALDGLSISVRLSVALRRRLQTGWPCTWSSYDSHVMPRRQGANVEADERLFDDLDEDLDDPDLQGILDLPIEEVVQRICGEIVLAATACAPLLHASSVPQSASPATRNPTELPDSG